MNQDYLLLSLIVVTFGLAIAYGVYQWFRATKARREHHHSVKERQDGGPAVAPAAGMPQQAAQPRKFR